MTEADLTDPLRPLAIRHLQNGKADMTLDGKPVGGLVLGYQINAVAGQPPHALLELAPTATRATEFDGLARVEVVVPTTPGDAAVEFLDAIDAEELQNTALSRMDLGAGPTATTEAILTTLKEWASGRS